jgi:transposase
MARPRLPITPHLSPEEIARRYRGYRGYRGCRSGREKTHWQILWLLTRTAIPPTPAQVATQVGLTVAWVRTVLKRWNAMGPEGLVDRRVTNNGGQWKLTAEQQAELFDAPQRPPADGGLWTGPTVARYVRDRGGVVVCKQTGWEWLCRLGFSPQVPRPRNPRAATAAEQQVWKRRPGRPDGRAAPRAPGPDRRVVGRG